MMMIVEEPAIELAGFQFGLNGFDVGHEGAVRVYLLRLDSSEELLCLRSCDPYDQHALDAALFAGDDFNSRCGHLQICGEELAQRVVCAAIDGRCSDPDLQCALIFAFDGIAAGSWRDSDGESHAVGMLSDFHHASDAFC